MKNIVVTGANGFIGEAIGVSLKSAGYNTIAVVRKTVPKRGYNTVYFGHLGNPLSSLFVNEKCDCIIHCANATDKDNYKLNVKGTKIWAEQAKKHGVKQQIFLSSISALQKTPSSYGKSKREIEKWFIKNNYLTLRLGMVIGRGGIFGNMKNVLRKYPVIPLLDNGWTPIYFIGIQRVCDIIKSLLTSNLFKLEPVLNIQQPTPIFLRTLLLEIKTHFNYHSFFLPVPSKMILYMLLFVEKIHITFLPFSSNNIRGLRQNKNLYIHSDYQMFGFREQSFSELTTEL